MTKQKTPATEAETPPVTTTEGQDTVQAPEATTEGQDTVQAPEATTEGQGADDPPANDPDGNPPSTETPEAPALNVQALTHLSRTIDMLNVTGHRLGLTDELRDLYGAEIVETEGEGWVVTIEGISCSPSDTLETALTNWANAARRACQKAAA